MIRRTRKPVSKQSRRFESRSIRRRFNEALEGNIIYTAKFADFYSEEDLYEEGAIGGGAQFDIDLDIEAKSLDELFRKVKKALYMDGKGYYWGVELSDMNDQTCFTVDYEGNGDNDLASEDEIEAWKNGEERLWLVRGRVHVMKTVKPSNVPDDEMEAFARANGLDIM